MSVYTYVYISGNTYAAALTAYIHQISLYILI